MGAWAGIAINGGERRLWVDLGRSRRLPTWRLAQVPPTDLHVPVLGQLPLPQLPLVDALEPGPLEIVGFDTLLGRGSLWEQALEYAPGDGDHTAVLSDLDPELDGLPLGFPMGSSGNGKWERYLTRYPAGEKTRILREWLPDSSDIKPAGSSAGWK
jgi:hypothetical protein